MPITTTSVQQIGWNEISRNTRARAWKLRLAVLAGLLLFGGLGGALAYRYWRAQPAFTPEDEAAVANAPSINWWKNLAVPAAGVAAPENDVFYVSPNGSDNASGRQNAPWHSLRYAVGRLQAGQTLYLRNGVYREYVEINNSGRPGAPLTIAGYPGEKAVIDGTGLNWRYGLSFTKSSYITVQNLTIRNFPGFGVIGWIDNNYITLRDLQISRIGTPIKFSANRGPSPSTHLTIENVNAADYTSSGLDMGPGAVADVTVRNLTLSGIVGGNETAIDGLSVENGTRIYLEKVKVIGHPGDGIDLKADNITVRQAEVRDFGRNGLKLWGRNGSIENCLVTSARSPVTVFTAQGEGPYFIRNNLFSNGPGHSYLATLGPAEAPKNGVKSLITLQGNIFYNAENSGTTIDIASWVQLQPDSGYNLYYAPNRTDAVAAYNGKVFTAEQINKGAWAAAVGADQRSRYLNPRVADDFTLQSNSPAVDALPAAFAPALDLAGHKRPAGLRSDIGPYEKL